jgi:hypothetical protein
MTSQITEEVIGSVTVYEDVNFKGQSATFDIIRRSAPNARFGLFPLKIDTKDLGINNDSLSSLKVNKCKVTLFENSGFQGESKVLTEDASHLEDDFNDMTSSLIVEFAG